MASIVKVLSYAKADKAATALAAVLDGTQLSPLLTDDERAQLEQAHRLLDQLRVRAHAAR